MNTMFRIVVILVVASGVATRVIPRNRLEEGLLKIIHKCRDGDVDSLPIKLPALRSLKLGPLHFDYDDYSMDLSEVKIKGLENLSVEKLSASPSQLTVSLQVYVPTLAIRASRYHLQGTAFFGMVTINDKGTLKANINNLNATAEVQFGADGSDTVIKRLNLDYLVDDVQAHLSGTSDIINDVINTMISDMLNDSSSELMEKTEDLIKDMINDLLRGYTPEKLINIITSV
ncbi:uncharacterized protein [Choristoneura fumiferana]|uniref:uncharacterized protein n=1 Tax=Choristoneura fumiferana TaxID=7141 RepID=UPI003D15D947